MIKKSTIFLCTILFFQISIAQSEFVKAEGGRFYLNNHPLLLYWNQLLVWWITRPQKR